MHASDLAASENAYKLSGVKLRTAGSSVPIEVRQSALDKRFMTEQEIRTIIVEALEYANILSVNEDSGLPFFLDGSEDVSLNQLDIDGLAAMELCIALEINTGVTIVPDDLQRMGTLNRLLTTVRKQLK